MYLFNTMKISSQGGPHMKHHTDPSHARYLVSKLREITLFNEINESTLHSLLPHIEVSELRKDSCLMRQGERSDAVYFVTRGKLKAVVSYDGREIFFGAIRAGEPVGEIQALSGGKHTADVYAMSDTELIKVTMAALNILQEKAPHVIHQLVRISRDRLLKNQFALIVPKLFGPVNDDMLHDLESQLEWLELRQGEVLFQEGDPGDCIYFVVLGRLRVVTRGPDNREIILGEVGMGESVGEMAILTGEPRSASVYAIRDCKLVRLSKSSFDRIISAYPQAMMSMTTILINRLRRSISGICPEGNVINIALIPVSRDVPLPEFANRLSVALYPYGRTLHLSKEQMDVLLQRCDMKLPMRDEDTYDIREIAWLNEQEMNHRFIVYETAGISPSWTLRCMRQADLILLVANADHAPDSGIIHDIMLKSGKGVSSVKRSLVLIHTDGKTLPTGTGRWIDAVQATNHHHLRWEQDTDFERIARFIAGKTTSLVLSGGGARAFAHLGVIRALNEAGVPIDMIGGASVGAVIASGYAMGWDIERMIEEVREIFVNNRLLNDYTFPVVSLFRCRNLDRVIQKGYGNTTIEDLWLNYFCVSSDLSTAELVIHNRESLWKAVRASVSYPGITVPVVRGTHLLVDGGVLNNLPVDIMRNLSRGKIIAVDVSAEEDLTIHIPEIPSPWKILLQRFHPAPDTGSLPNIFDILMRTAELGCIHRRHQIMKDSDVYLRPPVNHYKLLDFKSIDELVDIGYNYAGKEIQKWKNDLCSCTGGLKTGAAI